MNVKVKQVSVPLAKSLTRVFHKNPVGCIFCNDSSKRHDRVHQPPRPVHMHCVPQGDVLLLRIFSHFIGHNPFVIALQHNARQISQSAHSTELFTTNKYKSLFNYNDIILRLCSSFRAGVSWTGGWGDGGGGGGGDATVITNRIETHKRVKKRRKKERYLLGKNTTCEFSG